MIIQDTIITADGTVEVREIEVSDNYFDASEPATDPQADTDAMLVDLTYRLTLLELGVN